MSSAVVDDSVIHANSPLTMPFPSNHVNLSLVFSVVVEY